MSKIKVNNILPLPNTDLKIWTGGVTTAGSEADPAAKITLQNSTGRVGIGTVIPVSMLHLETSNSTSLITITRNDSSIADGDELGAILFGGTLNGTTHNSNAVVVRALADGAWSDVSSDAGAKLQIMTTPDESATAAVRVTIAGSGDVGIGTASPNCMLHVAGAAAFSGPNETFVTFADGDASPSVATGNIFKHHASTQAITTFDDGVCGQIITVISTAAITYNYTGSNLKCGSANIVTANGDVTMWVFDGTNWYLLSWMDVSANLSSGGF